MMGGIGSSDRLRAGSRKYNWLFAALALGSCLSNPQALAQSRASATAEPAGNSCRVAAAESPAGDPRPLFATCQGKGLMLGSVSSFEAIDSEAIGATLVDLRRGTERRVLLISAQPDGTPLAEDVTGQIALAAGRGPMSGIDGIELDLKAFARTGEIGVKGGMQDTGRDKADRINLGQQVAAERSRMGGASSD